MYIVHWIITSLAAVTMRMNIAAAAQEGTQVLLAHVRRWKHDKLFFKMARKAFKIGDVTDRAGKGFLPADAEASHTKGALRIYELTSLQKRK